MIRKRLDKSRIEMIVKQCARTGLIAALVAIGILHTSSQARAAGTGMAPAAAVANAGIGSCGANDGKALYDCVANVLDRMSDSIRGDTSSTRSALRSAAAELRAAGNKAQALSAISRCRTLLANALRQARATRQPVPGFGGSGEAAGLTAVVGILSRAIALIQQKG
ncbi:MAG: hypothetical protein AB7I42_09115 [Bradyrhizobium sp.]|uniref:hypothetical protein n=1 Tax=Bradyrhizobium sp. TaxID=376 RepID=UPI003D0D465C